MKFTKMHGLGNDFVVISMFGQNVANPAKLARTICDRHRGVGADGLILIGPPESDEADVRIRMFNADASPAATCGNGVRCVGKLAYEHGLARQNPLRAATDAGVTSLELTLDPDQRVSSIRADMGPPILDPKEIPVALGGERVVGVAMPLGEKILSVTCVSMGVPHAVFFVPDWRQVPLSKWGPQVERHPLFPQRTNVNFAQVIKPELVHMFTWERGVGPTQACGSGACSVCVAGVLNHFTERTITARLPGGELELEWNEASNHVFMSGPATEVFTGEWPD
ncbi:MAG: diaminopimelate epimerase [Planctomycetes bacterium]|nr:diaminopimelate epimerase [Planctomycetota bacterium]